MKTIITTLFLALFFTNITAQNWEIELLFQETDTTYFGFFTDLDNDSDLDYLNHANSQEIGLRINEGDANYSGSQTLLDLEDGALSNRFLTIDIDMDGDLDLVHMTYGVVEVSWYSNLGDFTFGPKQIISDDIGNGDHLIAHDMDDDGDQDLVLSTLNFGLIWLENDLDLGVWTQHLIYEYVYIIDDLFIIDIDNDGDEDIMTSYNEVTYNLGGGNYSDLLNFTTVMNNHSSIDIYDPFYQDMDGDGDLDCSYYLTDLFDFNLGFYWAENDGTGEFNVEHEIAEAFPSSNSVYADLDNDGDLDIFYLHFNEEFFQIKFIEKIGDAIFEPEVVLGEFEGVSGTLGAQDIDNDGFLDLTLFNQPTHTMFWIKNGFSGCLDNEACNYDSEALYDNGSCCYGICGCLDSFAANYNSTADCENGSCLYSIEGIVFYDDNENGIQDLEDYPLANNEVFIESIGITVLTNVAGEFSFTDLQAGNYTVEIGLSGLFPFVYPSPFQEVDVMPNTETPELSFGRSHDLLEFEIGVSQYSDLNSTFCGEMMEYIITYQNLGNVPVDGTVEFTYSELFQDYMEITPIESVDGNVIIYTFQDLQPGESRNIYVYLQTPSVDFIGETVISTVNVTGFYNEEPTAYGFSETEDIVTCAYDPNDKQVFPAGVADEHYVFDDQELEYLVRFQNTGNAPATTVLISDTIDENLNLDSFELVGYSHPVNVSIHADTRIVDFLFAEIMLPDSVNNEPESHGFVSYKITPLEDAPLLTEINNTAYIYFDNNEAVITNTTWSTLYDCSIFEAEITVGDASLFASDGTAYQWFLDGEIIESATEQIFTPSQNGNYSVEVENMMGCMLLTEEVVYDIISVEEYLENPFTLYPNPMAQSATLDLGSTDGYSVNIYSVDGRVVRDYGRVFTNQLEMVKGDLKAGHYLVEVLSFDGFDRYHLPLIIK